jgi:release factor glutamine methyltransferase
MLYRNCAINSKNYWLSKNVKRCLSKNNNVFNRLKLARDRLEDTGVPDAESSARILFEHATASETKETFEELIERRCRREPLQYIVGNWDFHNITLKVKAPVLIPRPETEELVENILKSIPHSATKCILDIGTGTGAISLALLKARPNCSAIAIDVDPAAIALTKENALALGLSGQLQVELISIQDICFYNKFDLIVSNPPYIPTSEISSLQPEILQYENRLALVGGEDGGDLARVIIKKSNDMMKLNGELFLELHHSHNRRIVESWLRQAEHRELRLVETIADFAGIHRFHRLRKVK